MTSLSIIHYTGATAKSHSVVASLALDCKDAGDQVTVLDLAQTTTIHQGFPPGWLVRLLGHRILSPTMPQVLAQNGIALETLPRPVAARDPLPEHREDLELALRSELLTYFRLDHIPNTSESRRLEKSLRQGMLQTYTALSSLWSRTQPDRVLIPNGRTSRQKAARLVAEHRGIEVMFYENGRAKPDSYYLGKTQPHDRVASQAEVHGGFPLPDTAEVSRQAASWLKERMSGASGTNSFSELWELKQGASVSEEPLAVFFASSFDEFLAFGPMWSIDQWSHQFEAFDRMMSILEKEGVNLVLRLHPNLGSKSRLYFQREMEQALSLRKAHPTVTIHWHNDPINSYDLVSRAHYVIVERSTIGLEASVMGKPVWVTQATQWDQVADIRQVLTPSDIDEDIMNLWAPQKTGAERFVSYWIAQEHPLRFNWKNWATWNLEKAPTIMKLAQLALPHSLHHKGRLLSLELARRSNVRFVPPENFQNPPPQ